MKILLLISSIAAVVAPVSAWCAANYMYCWNDLNAFPGQGINSHNANQGDAYNAVVQFNNYIMTKASVGYTWNNVTNAFTAAYYPPDPSQYLYLCWNYTLTVIAPCNRCQIGGANDTCVQTPESWTNAAQWQLFGNKIIGNTIPLIPGP